MKISFLVSTKTIDNTDFIILKPSKILSNAEYDEIKHKMEDLGAHWRQRVDGFVLGIKQNINKDDKDWKEKNQFYSTPIHIAKRVVELAELYNNCNILEPSAGDGALLDMIPSELNPNYYIVEPNDINVSKLINKEYNVINSSFEDFYYKAKENNYSIDRIIMNPPFSGQRDIKHTMLAYELLNDTGILVSIVSENSLYYNTTETSIFKNFIKETNAEIEDIKYGSFIDSGTLIDTIIIKIKK